MVVCYSDDRMKHDETDVVDALSVSHITEKLSRLKNEKLKTYPAQPEETWIPTPNILLSFGKCLKIQKIRFGSYRPVYL